MPEQTRAPKIYGYGRIDTCLPFEIYQERFESLKKRLADGHIELTGTEPPDFWFDCDIVWEDTDPRKRCFFSSMYSRLQKGDILIIESLKNITTTFTYAMATLKDLRNKGVNLYVLDFPVNTLNSYYEYIFACIKCVYDEFDGNISKELAKRLETEDPDIN